MTIPEAFEELTLNPEAVAGVTKTIQWNITGDEAGVWAFQIVDGVGQLIPGGVEKPDVILTVSDKNWIAIGEGRQDPTEAFMTGKLKITGDMMLAMKIPQLFQDRGRVAMEQKVQLR
jgi:putative sterol carrier protein